MSMNFYIMRNGSIVLGRSLVFFSLCFAFSFLQAQELSILEDREGSVWQQDGFYPSVFYFPVGKYLLARDYRGNGATFVALDKMLTSSQIIENIDTIEIIGACSPIASKEYNRKLSFYRCLSLRFYLYKQYSQVAESFPIQMNFIGIDHVGYNILRQKKPSLSEKEICNMLQYVAIRLKMKDGSYVVPGADKSKVPAIEAPASSVIGDTVFIKRDTMFIQDTIMVHVPKQTTATPKAPLYIALKNNLLYDAALLPNLTAEVYLGRRWSLAIEGNWSWWTFDRPIQNRWYHRIQAAGTEIRYWVKSPYPLHGHAVGLYSMVGNYDVRFFTKNEDTKGYLNDLSWSAGLSYAYSIPIAHRFNMEFGLACGYMGGRYYPYNYCMKHEQWEQLAVRNRNYFGPTRVGISLVWLLGTGNGAKDREKYTVWKTRKTNDRLMQLSILHE